MANLTDYKVIEGTFSNDSEWVKVIYDYSLDAGATTYKPMLHAHKDMVIVDFYANFIVAVTSSDTCTLDVGIGDGGTELLNAQALATTGATAYTAGQVVGKAAAAPVRFQKDTNLCMTFNTTAATAGKIEFNIELRNQ